jgi:HAD superfamily hydrolase (TIGR01509 family)
VTRSVIFDCDGVLVDTELVSNGVLAGLLTEAGLPMTRDDCISLFRGRSMKSVLEIAEERFGGAFPFDVRGRYWTAIEEIFARELEPVPGVLEALEQITLPSCVASSGPHRKMAVTLRTTGLWDRFEGRIFSATEVAHGKPAPDLFLHAAARMGFDPASTAVVEDSVPGIEAAVAAGMRALAFTRGSNPADLVAAGGEPFGDMVELPALLAA